MNNILDESEQLCTGCGVCCIICPKDCIEIYRNMDGFYRPQVAVNNCIGCGICKKVCYKYFEAEKDGSYSIERAKGYLSYSKNDYNRINSSSGGIGRELCHYGLKNNYQLCGVEYDYQKNNVKHSIVNDAQGIECISKSKYLPSYTKGAFTNIKHSERLIIFGTPCQIYGLRKYAIKNKIHDLILVDFFCHGVPSLNAWDKYLEYVSRVHKINDIKSVDFRDKKQGWHNYHIKIVDVNGKDYTNLFREDMFSHLFLMNLCLSEACHDCKLRFNKIYSDIRLADFWGPKCQDDESGTSLVLTNSQKGEEIFKELENLYFEDITFEEIKQSQYVEKLIVPKERKIVMKEPKTDLPLEKIHRHVKKIKLIAKYKAILYHPIYLIKVAVHRLIMRKV